MTAGVTHPKTPAESLTAGLIIVTGASHTGKSSVIRALLPKLEPPAAVLAVDEVLRGTLIRPAGDPWKEIPLAYDLIQVQAAALIFRGWLVIVESTFTYVPPKGEGELHEDVLGRLIGLAERHGVPWALCQVQVASDLAVRRGAQTKRLPSRIIATTAHLHEKLTLPAKALKLSTTEGTPEDAARTFAAHLPASFKRR